ncbi:phosphatase PAP2 family protein [Methylomonas sp. BW4-1]|uniref:phosphatase PAP2 family protein n=1 Tax=Methylomonas sp. BW4-1 TaxID=3376685 RepID=UPI0040428C9A
MSTAHGIRSILLDRFFAAITWAGSLFILAPITAVLSGVLVRNSRIKEAGLMVLSLTGVALFSRIAKLWFARPRPDFFPVVGEIPLDASFPSAHTAQIVAFATALCWMCNPDKLGLNFYALTGFTLLTVSLVAVSRVYLQVHFPSDVIAGALLGLLWVLGLINLLQNGGIFIR